MDDTTLSLHIENCRAIREADIRLDEITVLTGINASGKSTIAHIFSSLIGLSENYHQLKNREIWAPFAETEQNLYRLEQRLSSETESPLGGWTTRFVTERMSKIGLVHALRDFEQRYEHVISQCFQRKSDTSIFRAMSAFLRAEGIEGDVDTVWPSLPSTLSERIQAVIESSANRSDKRAYGT